MCDIDHGSAALYAQIQELRQERKAAASAHDTLAVIRLREQIGKLTQQIRRLQMQEMQHGNPEQPRGPAAA
jgi:hypothetical protein